MSEKVKKGFSMNLSDGQIGEFVPADKIEEEKEKLARPYELDTEDINDKKKLYLLLMVFMDKNDGENVRDFEFFKGTSQEVYDYIKDLMVYDDNSDLILLIDESRILVDSPKISISYKCSFYKFMKNMYELGKVKDDNYNIEDYHDESSEEED